MPTRTGHIATTIIDAIATHNLLHYATGARPDEAERMVAGATLATLGYAFGPQLEERIAGLGDREITDKMREELLTAAAFGVGGGIFGYFLGNEAYESSQLRKKTQAHPVKDSTVSQELQNATTPGQRPKPLILVASAGWLGYSLINQQTSEERHRQLWGLGAGVIGHSYGPELLHKIRDLVVPEGTKEYARELYQRGGIVLGAILGAGAGLYAARKHGVRLFNSLEKLDR